MPFRRPRVSRHRTRGTTLPELIVVLALVALLAGLAVPALAQLRQGAALGAAANQMLQSLHYARGLAITRGVAVGLCQTDDGERCVASPLAATQGFMVFINADADQPAQRDPGEPVLRWITIAPTLSLRATRAAVNYWPVPRAGSTTTFSFCDRTRVMAGRSVVVSQTGRPRTTLASRSPLTCS